MGQVGANFFAVALAAVAGICGAGLAASSVRAENCPGNPDALGTSRTIVVGPAYYQQVGIMQYPETLPLADKEVVITFDDGPLPPYSNQVLDILTAECVKATFFIVGEMAHTFPSIVRREFEAGYTIGTHSWDHPKRFERLTGDKLTHEIDDGIAAVSAALGNPEDLAPFFRIPGLGRSPEVESALTDRSLVVFGADAVADDWHHRITPAQIIALAISRLEKRGKGILLLHDIHRVTVAALPGLLKELKNRGFRVVHVVGPSPPIMTAEVPQTWPPLQSWALAAASPEATLIDADSSAPAWPAIDASRTPDDIALSIPDAADFDTGLPPGPSVAEDTDGHVPWPEISHLTMPASEPELPAPGPHDIGISMKGRAPSGDELGLRPGVNAPPAAASTDHGLLRHYRQHAHHRRHSPGEGQHAGLSLSIALLFTPVR
jgi:peptidoglycan-N-acetylglucosamine deacetylase